MTKNITRLAFGVLLIVHGLAHAVLPLRGAGIGGNRLQNVAAITAYAVALLGFVAAGLGVWRRSPFNRLPVWFVALPAAASLGAVLTLGYDDLWPVSF